MKASITTQKPKYNELPKAMRNHSTLGDIAMRFGAQSRPLPQEVSIFREQFYMLILNANSNERKTIAETLSRSPYTPKAIAIFLAMEEIAIATPMLLYSPVLQPGDLNLIISKCSLAHAKVISRRNNLDATNVKALIKADDTSTVIRSLIELNPAINKNREIIELLRQPVNQYSKATEPVQTTRVKPEDIPVVSKKPTARDLSDTLLELASKGGKIARQEPKQASEEPVLNTLTSRQIERQLLSTARDMDHETFAISVQHFCGLDHKITLGFMQKQDAGMLASLLCALELSLVSASRILLLMNRDIGRNAEVFKLVMEKYMNLDQQACIDFFERIGADFSQSYLKNPTQGNNTSTHNALSLAARQRRAALQKENRELDTPSQATQLTA